MPCWQLVFDRQLTVGRPTLRVVTMSRHCERQP
jgi:hypothetical protein